MAHSNQAVIRDSFRFRFSGRKIRDIQLKQWIAEDIENGQVNVSEVIKDLLYAWYVQQHNGGNGLMPPILSIGAATSQPPNHAGETHEDPNDPLVRAFANISFDEFSG
jgi:hypothetical protein